MQPRLGVILALFVLASVISIPALDAEADDTELFTYKSQLDVNGRLVYNEVANATTIDGESKTFTVTFNIDRLFDDTASAKAYANSTVQDALAAEYLTNPMVPYLWDYPVKAVEVSSEIAIYEGKEKKYIVESVTFTLSVPEGMTAEKMKKLNEALSKVNVTGNTDAEKVISIMAYLNGMYFQKDEEGTVSNIYNAVVELKTTSAGVSQAFNQLCILNNIPAITVAGDNVLATNESKSFWNYVYLEGDIDGETKYSWYIVDPTYATTTGIAGYLTEVVFDNKAYSMSSAHNRDLTLSSDNTLDVPQLAKNKYVQVGGPTFFEKYGEMLVMAAIGALVIVGMLYAVRTGVI